MLCYQQGKGRRDELGVWDERHTTIFKRIKRNKALLRYSRELYSMSCDTYNGKKESEKEYIMNIYMRVSVYVSHFAVHLELAQHCEINYT